MKGYFFIKYGVSETVCDMTFFRSGNLKIFQNSAINRSDSVLIEVIYFVSKFNFSVNENNRLIAFITGKSCTQKLHSKVSQLGARGARINIFQ